MHGKWCTLYCSSYRSSRSVSIENRSYPFDAVHCIFNFNNQLRTVVELKPLVRRGGGGKGEAGAGEAYIIHFSLLMQRQLYYLTVAALSEVYGSNH